MLLIRLLLKLPLWSLFALQKSERNRTSAQSPEYSSRRYRRAVVIIIVIPWEYTTLLLQKTVHWH